jgi:hypothetical protein
MATRLATKTALAALAAVGLFLPFGAPLPGSCLRTIGVAGAAPSPSCSGDLRECLRASADLHQTTFGGRYVTADDVARCMEAFRACTSGGASRGGNTPLPSPTSRADDTGRANLPQRFTVNYERPLECQTSGEAVTCTGSYQEQRSDDTYTESYELSGIASGMTLTGNLSGRSDATGFCVSHTDYSASVTFAFSPNGTVAIKYSPAQMKTVYSGGCADSPPRSSTSVPFETAGTWSPSE